MNAFWNRLSDREKLFVAGEPGHRIARTDTDKTAIGLDAHDIGDEMMPGPAVPGRHERRVEIDPVAALSDAGDLQLAAPPRTIR